MFLAKRLINVAAQKPSAVNSLTTSFRTLCMTPQLLQQQQKPDLRDNANSVVAEGTKTISKIEREECQEVFKNVNKIVSSQQQGRLFAVVHLCGKQFKVTAGDIILVEGYWPPTTSDEIRLEKVLLAGSKDFTLIGTPILETGLVNIKATIIEKTLTHTKTHFKKKRRKQFMRINFQRSPNTMIRINSVEIGAQVNRATKQDGKLERLF